MLLCGHISLSRIKRTPQSYGGKGMAVAGLILGYIGFILSIGVFIIKKMVEADIRDSFMK